MPPEPPQISNAERDLLFGVFAVQLGLVSAQEILAVAGAWAADRSRGLAARMLEGRLVAEPMHRLLTAMVQEAVAVHGGDAARTLETFGGSAAVQRSLGGSVVLSADGVERPDAWQVAAAGALAGFDSLPPRAPARPVSVTPAATARPPSAQPEPDAPAEASVTPESQGRYELRDRRTTQTTQDRRAAEIGRGGIGRVLLAFDQHLGREVALKELLARELPPGAGPTHRLAAAVTRFLREARVTGQLEHPNIVPVYELGRRDDGTLYYTMKMVRGRTLADAIRAAPDLPARLALLNHFVDLCQALAYAHSRGVVHRDIKPENVMLGEFGETVVLDWGLAKVFGAADPRGEELAREAQRIRDVHSGQTVDGMALGTPNYMSPEAADGRLHEVDERSDVWSLGAVLYEILTGRPPFEGSNVFVVLGQVMKAELAPVRSRAKDAPRELTSVCEKALSRDRAQRYQSARELAGEVSAYLTGGRVRAYEYGLGELLRRFASRHKLPIAVAGVGLVMLAGLGVFAYLREASARQTAERLRAEAEDAGALARQRWAESHREGARAALARGEPLEARAKLRTSLEEVDSLAGRVLWGKLRAEPLVWRKEMGALVYHVAFSPTGQEVAVAGHDRSIYLLSVDTAELRVLRGHEDWVATLAYAPGGGRLVSTSADGSLRIWDVASGRTLHALKGHKGPLHDAAWSPDGELVASCGQDRTVRLWQASSGAELLTLTGHADIVWTVEFVADGLLASADRAGVLKLWDARDGSLRSSVAHPKGIACLIASPDGRRLAAGRADQRISVWSLEALLAGGQPGPDLELAGHTDGVQDLAFSPDGRRLASSSFDRSVRLWNLETGVQEALLAEHREYVGGVDFSPDGRLLVTGSEDRSVALWRLPLTAPERIERGHSDVVYALAVSPDGRRLASGGADRSLRLWDAERGAEERVLGPLPEALRALAFRPDGQRLWALGWDRQLHDFDLKTGEARTLELEGPADLMCLPSFDPHGGRLAASDYNRRTWIWSLEDGRALMRLQAHEDLVFTAAFSPDGRRLATPGWDHSVRLWELSSGAAVRVLAGHAAQVEAVAFGPDGESLVSGDWNGSVRVWELGSGAGRPLAELGDRVISLAVSPDGRTLAAGTEEGPVQLIDLHGGPTRALRGHRNAVERLVFSPDGQSLYSAGDDGTVRAWDVSSGAARFRSPLLVPERDAAPWVSGPDGLRRAGEAGLHLADRRWQEALGEARAAAAAGDSLCLELGPGEVALWSRARDELLARQKLPGLTRLAAADGACLALAGGDAHLVRPGREPTRLAERASALAWTGDEILMATEDGILVFGPDGGPRETLPAPAGATALLAGGSDGQAWIAIGYPDGTVEILQRQGGQGLRNLSLDQVSSSPVLTMQAGPMDSLFLGFASGVLGLWDKRTGARLDFLKLNGPIAQMCAHGQRLTATTLLGDMVDWDLALFFTDYCELLGQVWAAIPVVWADGRPQRKPPPTVHPLCGRTL
jgi:WD40 repeat protein